MRVDPDDATRPVRGGHACERAERDRVIAAQNERDLSAQPRLFDELRDAVAERENLRQEARAPIVYRKRLRDRRLDVAEIVRHDAERRSKMLRELGVANRRRPHVDATATGAEIERGADQGHTPLRLHAHGRKANVTTLVDQPGGGPLRRSAFSWRTTTARSSSRCAR